MSAPGLKQQLLWRVLLPLLLVLVAAGVVFYALALRFANQILDQSLHDTARSLAQQMRVVDGRLVLDLPRAASEILQWDPIDRVHFRVSSSARGLLGGEGGLPIVEPAVPNVSVYSDTEFNGEALRMVSLRLDAGGADERLVVSVAETLHKRDQLARQALVAVVVPQLALVLLAGVLVLAGVGRALAPLGTLARAVNARSAGDFSPLPDSTVPAEVRPLTASINALLTRLDSSLGAQQRFIADAAHQLRTPLAAIKVQVERAVREQDPATREAILQQLREAIDRVVRLSNQLLLLARSEPGSDPRARFAELDLRALAFDMGAQWVPRALAEGADFGFEAPENAVWIRGDRLLLGELINNLVDNALKYGGAGVRVTLKVVPGAAPALVVEDNGPGVPAEERENVLGRFYRRAGSAGAGSGLGLAIVREIALAHDAELSLDATDGGGLLVRVRFPARGPGIPEGPRRDEAPGRNGADAPSQ